MTRTSTTVVSVTNRPAPKSVTRSGARAMMRIGRSSDVVAEIQRVGVILPPFDRTLRRLRFEVQ
ncbi:MAG: hypothetical protein RSE12_08465 [Fuscovulum sp.]|nr:MAG: hypothetical protein RSE12_08465 [Fuscovulum sp.]